MKKYLVYLNTCKEYGGILLGCLVVAVAFVLFINPYQLVPGGLFGVSIVLHNLFPSVQVGTFGYILEVPVLVLSAICLGKKVGIRTLVASFATPLFMNLLSWLVYPTEEALNSLNPAILLGGRLNLSDDIILATIFGPILIGIGDYLIVRSKASSGGSDVLAMILSKYTRIKFSSTLLMVDGLVVFLGFLVIGLGWGSQQEATDVHSIVLSGYSLICIFVTSQTIAYMISGSKNDKIIFIITSGTTTRLRNFILNDLDRTATRVPCQGLYTQDDKDMLMLVVHQKEVDFITTRIQRFCPEVFIVVTDAYDAYGERWNNLPNPGDLVLK